MNRGVKCGRRALAMLSLGLGLGATGALGLAIATDFWLFTVEGLSMSVVLGDQAADTPLSLPTMSAEDMLAFNDSYDMDMDESMLSPSLSLHSGLWRACLEIENWEMEMGK